MLLLCSNAIAQGPMNHGKWEEGHYSKPQTQPRIKEVNEFSETEISVEKKVAVFSNLPEKRKSAMAVVTDVAGDPIMQKAISPENNYIDLRRLSKGEMYFITIMYKNKSQKGFVVHL